MSASDKTKLDGIASNANAYSLPAASTSTRGGVKTGYTANGKNYPVQLSNEQMYVNVPWTDTNTTYGNMTGATTSAAGASGLVPAPEKGTTSRYLRADGTWSTPPNTTYSTATTSSSGLMSAADKTKLNGIAAGAQVNTLTGVKGNAESSYRTGNVNLTSANIGALPASGGTVSGSLTVTGATTLEGTVRIKPSGTSYGSVINIGDGDYIRISEDTDDVLNVKAKQINITSTNQNAVYINGNQAAAYKQLTQAQYNALTTAQKTNGTIYFITDGN